MRFREKCRFDPLTGCVLWTGATTAGRGNSARYGNFWYDGAMVRAHLWSAVHIHQLDISDRQCGHCCPAGPNTLCVEHLTPQTQLENLAEQNDRRRLAQSNEDRRHWLFIHLGIERPPPGPVVDEDAVPFYLMPGWLR